MENVLNSMIENEVKTYVKNVVDELSKLSTTEIVEISSRYINQLFPKNLHIKGTKDGGANINIKLNSEEVKYLLTEITKKL